MATIKELFEAKVADGVIDWKKANWDSIGCPADKNSKKFLADYPRWKQNGNGSDCAYVTVNGINVTLHGTSNQNAEEYARYQTKGNGTPRGPRSSAPVVDTKNKETAIALFKSRSDWTADQIDMLANMAGISDNVKMLMKSRSDWTADQIEMLLAM